MIEIVRMRDLIDEGDAATLQRLQRLQSLHRIFTEPRRRRARTKQIALVVAPRMI